MAKRPRYVKTLVPLSKGNELAIYAGIRVRNAMHDITENMNVYQGGKLLVVLEAVYQQGKKDGRREVKESFESMMDGICHLNPGQRNSKRRKHTSKVIEG